MRAGIRDSERSASEYGPIYGRFNVIRDIHRDTLYLDERWDQRVAGS